MGLFDRFRKKNNNTEKTTELAVPVEPAEKPEESMDDIWKSEDSLSFSMSKNSILEEEKKPSENLILEPDSLSNEEITRGNFLLETYEVISDAIKGGMGSVWKVHHTGWNTDLAMKRPQPRFFAEAGEKRKENFIHECEAWINLGLHPNIVSCYYIREIGGVPTIFSEWMENGSLKNRIEDGSLYAGTEKEVQERILDIAIQFARGLHYAHESKDHLIHQDVKPDNLLLTNTWEAKVADFGLARARLQLDTGMETTTPFTGQTDEGLTHLAATGGYTPAYCSVEQFLGRPLSRRTDIYSWAVSVLEMYLGKRPWKNGTEVAIHYRSYFEQTRIKIPRGLQEILEGCLKEHADERIHDFGVIQTKLERIYHDVCHMDYPRTVPKVAGDIAASLNNKALSYIDLGKHEQADELFKDVILKDGSNFLYRYNYALHRWNEHQISDIQFVSDLRSNLDKSEFCDKTMEAVYRIRGGFDEGKEAYYYSVYRSERPESLEPLIPKSDISTDGKYRVKGYLEKDQYGNEHYGYRIENLETNEIQDYPNEYEDYGISTPRDGLIYMHAHYYKDKTAYFVGPNSEFVAVEADVLWLFDAKSGKLLLSLPPLADDGDTMPYEVLGYTQSGIIEYKNWEQKWERWLVHAIKPEPDIELSYELAGIATVNARLEAEHNMITYYENALTCWKKGDIDGTYQSLKQSLDDQVLLFHEPSLSLYSKLSPYYRRGTLLSVVPTPEQETPVPPRNLWTIQTQFTKSEENKNRADNGQTEVTISYKQVDEYDSYNDMYEYTFYYNLEARDIHSGEKYFEVENLDITQEADWNRFSKDRYLGLMGETLLWYGQEYAADEIIDLAEISNSPGKFRLGESRIHFFLPNGYILKNTVKGVNIGGFLFDDWFTDFRPLWNSDIVACRDHNYRLVYHYLPKDEPAKEES